MAKGDRSFSGGPKPVQRIELTDKHKTLRIILLAVTILIAVIAFTTGLTELLYTKPGWQNIESTADGRHCGQDFTFMYYLGAGEMSPTEENRALTKLYSQATQRAYRLFSVDEASGDGIYGVNAHPNEVVTVDPALYAAFEQVQAWKNRNLYLAPVYVEYNRVFLYEDEQEAMRYDPTRDPELLQYVAELAAFANDPNSIDLELLGNNQVRLNISEAYLAYAQENALDKYVDFGMMKNAFIVDVMAQILQDNGFTRGYIASYDGFNRNLDTSGEKYTFNIYDRYQNEIYLPAAMEYTQPASIVFLRNYPMSQIDRWNYYSFSDGKILTTMIDPADGISKSATDNLVAYSASDGCAEILLRVSSVYIADALDEEALKNLTQDGIYSVWFEGTTLKYLDKNMSLMMAQVDGLTYQAQLVD